jgi:hypothetical protein
VGQLQITVSGLPSDLHAAVSLKAADGSSQTITASTTLSDLQPGAYAINAKGVGTIYTFMPQPLEQILAVTAGQTAKATVSYAAVTGALEFQVSGLLFGVKPFITVSGPNNFQFTFEGPGTVPNLPPGDYFSNVFGFTDRPHPVDNRAGFNYSFIPPPKLTLKAGETAHGAMTFSPSSGSLHLEIAGLPVGALADVKVDVNVFINGVETFTVPASSFVNYFLAGSHLVKAFGVTFDDFNYVATPETTVTIANGQVAEQKIVYVPTDGKLRVTVSTPPPDAFNPLRVKGPGFDSQPFNGNKTFTSLTPGAYILTAESVTVAPGKPACIFYSPDLASQARNVVAGRSETASVVYTKEKCN